MKVLILEDEVPAQMQLKRLFSVYYPDTVIAAVLDSVDKATRWLALNSADLIMMDVELSDGICFELFNRVTSMPPVIIVTAYEHYALAALKKSAVDYLLKPVGDTEFVEAVEKCIKPVGRQQDLRNLGKLMNQYQDFKQRFIIKVGDQIIVINTKDIAYFFSEDKSTYIMTREGKHFKLSRNCIASISSINSISKFFNSRLRIELLPPYKQPILVSRQRVPVFMRWIEGLSE